MDTLIDIMKKGLDPENGAIGPKLIVGIACFGAALVINALLPGRGDEYIEELRRQHEAARPA